MMKDDFRLAAYHIVGFTVLGGRELSHEERANIEQGLADACDFTASPSDRGSVISMFHTEAPAAVIVVLPFQELNDDDAQAVSRDGVKQLGNYEYVESVTSWTAEGNPIVVLHDASTVPADSG
jgi:hypothetical protein